MDQIIQRIFDFFLFGGRDFALFIISMIPFIELRGSIIFGAAMGIPWQHAFLVSFLGNIFPVPFLILLARPIFTWLKTTRLLAGFTQKVEDRLMKKADKVTVQKYSAVGLFLFVAVPLPGTGAWSGSLIAALLDIKMRYALPAVIAGVFAAGVIMTVASYGLLGAIQLF
ncbi:COG2426 family protein [Intestinimonas butyriciproducens]|uniref:COG2426 family protein n=1 Tax=Intestinimonas butyriciproducens TaxID=1297617 RepID=UPI0031F6E78A